MASKMMSKTKISHDAILDTCPPASGDGTRIRREIWEFQLLDVLILILKQDYSVIEGQWHTASRLTAIFSQVVTGLDLSKDEMRQVEKEKLPDAVDNMFLVARRIQARYLVVPKVPSKEKERMFLLGCFKTVIEALVVIAAAYLSITAKVMSSPWLLQLMIMDNGESVIMVMDMVVKVVRANWLALKEVPHKTLFSIMDELVYKLSAETDPGLGAGAAKCVLCICEYHKPMVASLCARYRGLRPLLARWEGQGFSRDLKHLHKLLEAGNAQRAEMEVRNSDSAVLIQANWKGFITRKKLAKANKAFAKLHKAFRNRQRVREETLVRTKHQSEMEYRAKVDKYLQNEEFDAATKIQKLWRGFSEREKLTGRRDNIKRIRAAVKIQRTFRTWLERIERKKGDIPIHLRPPGLTDNRRVELQKCISNHREENPAMGMLGQYYGGIRQSRKDEHKREMLITRLDIDSELCSLAPPLDKVTQKDVEMYSTRSVPVATKARVNHMETLRNLQLPWWKKLGDEFQEAEIPEEEVLLF
ncbi:IQCB1-like protein [Mya arenaria]|uniref:IQCB1-like protein n=1 Tax=Mya arenaria TaxID=6604 RepID=A0ABY7E568_MYAAR|nr:IQCB1-like protein [Mya arenaria]